MQSEGRFLFAGSECGASGGGAWTVAVRLRSLVRALEVVDAWREDPTLPSVIRTTVLHIHPHRAFDGADLLFP